MSAAPTTAIAGDTRRLLLGSVWSRLLAAAIGLVTARVLGPADFGILKLVNFVPSLAKFGSLGFDGVAQREIAHIRGARQGREKERQVKDIAFTADLVWATALCLMVGGVALFADRGDVRDCLWIAALSLLAGQVNRLYDAVSAVDKRFGLMAQAFAVTATVEALVVLPTVYWGRMYSVVIGTFVGSLAGIGWYRRSIRLGFTLRADRSEFARLFRIALPLAGGTMAFGAFAWIERLEVLALFGSESLGIYMLSVVVFELGLIINRAMLRASSIHLFEQLGSDSSSRATSELIITPSLTLAYVFPLVGGLLWLVGPVLLSVFLPQYLGVVSLLPWIAVMLTLRGLAAMPMTALNSARLNMQKQFMLLWVGAAGLFAVTIFIAARLGLGVDGVAAGKSLTLFVVMLVTYKLTYRFFFQSHGEILKFLAVASLPLAASAPLLWGLTAWFPDRGSLASVIKSLLFILMYSPFLVYLETRTKFVSHFLGRPSRGSGDHS